MNADSYYDPPEGTYCHEAECCARECCCGDGCTGPCCDEEWGAPDPEREDDER